MRMYQGTGKLKTLISNPEYQILARAADVLGGRWGEAGGGGGSPPEPAAWSSG